MSFTDDVARACEHALKARGFYVLRQGTILFPINDEFSGWLGLNRAKHGSVVNVYPFVGIHAHEVGKLIAKCRGEKYKNGWLATFALPISAIIENFPGIAFEENQDIDKSADDFAQLISDNVIEYYRSMSAYDKILPMLIQRETTGGGYPERVASVYYLTGEKEKAKIYINWIIAAFAKRGHHAIVDDIKEFSESFLSCIDNSTD